jgi:hypothetical protein
MRQILNKKKIVFLIGVTSLLVCSIFGIYLYSTVRGTHWESERSKNEFGYSKMEMTFFDNGELSFIVSLYDSDSKFEGAKLRDKQTGRWREEKTSIQVEMADGKGKMQTLVFLKKDGMLYLQEEDVTVVFTSGRNWIDWILQGIGVGSH